jgi:hypothetical protein
MKKNSIKLITSLLVLILVIGTSSCKKDDDPGSDPETDKITLIVDANYYEPYLIQDTDNGYELYVTGSFANGQNGLTLTFDSDVTVGTHDLSDIESSYGIFWDQVINLYAGNIDRYWSRSGSIIVEEYNAETGKLKGTFSATCKTLDDRSVTITSGTFIVFL